ncbi:glucan endo-1,3-beta-glucosidase-like [Panicum virgatum]|uniref:glucan endo-1,3-beta-glucosidase-like n=1 Tax=Panicum virgatum TaxID=38727 RepID=UPI0019D5F5A2|nr:glucan endo-1,3-beta-glucosidase-like [Panicum virgatum]
MLAEFTLGGGANDFYDVRNVDGFNLPVDIEPAAGAGGRSSGHQPGVLERDGGEERRRPGGGLQERMPCVRNGLVLPRPAVRIVGDMQAERVLGAVQGAVPAGLQLCPRRSSTFTCNDGADYLVTFCPSAGMS